MSIVNYDRRYYSKYAHMLEVAPAQGPIRLRVRTDNDELKAALLAEIAILASGAELPHSSDKDNIAKPADRRIATR